MTIEEFEKVCHLTVELARLRQNECKHLCIENAGAAIFAKLLKIMDNREKHLTGGTLNVRSLSVDHADVVACNCVNEGKKYRPSNGQEGDMFAEKFCARCQNNHVDLGCDIQSLTMAFDVDDAEYPSEWIYGEGGEPLCTAFAEK